MFLHSRNKIQKLETEVADLVAATASLTMSVAKLGTTLGSLVNQQNMDRERFERLLSEHSKRMDRIEKVR